MSLFGNTAGATANKPLFSFGNTSTQQQQPGAGSTSTSTTPSFSFGGSAASQTQAKPSLFGGFGTSSNPPSNTPNNAPGAPTAGGFSLFGNSQTGTTTQQQQQNQQPSTTSFGGFGGFGSSASTSTNTGSGGGLFGGGFGGSQFGQNNQNQNQNQQQQQQQQQQIQQNPQNLFASTARANPLTVSQLLPAPGTAAPPQPSLEERLMSIKNSWDPNSPTNRFSYYFYNLSPAPLTVPLTQLPLPPNVAASPHLTQLYKQAVLENPQPDKFIPALASSMDDLKKRVDAQRNMANLHLGKLKSQDIQGKISSANKKHYAETVVRIERLSREQIKLEEKLVHICARLAGLQIYAPTGTKDEAEMLLMLERIRDELGVGSKSRAPGRHPAAHGPRLAGIVNELWMVVSQRKALMMGARSGTPDGTAGPEWGVADESELRKVLEVLAQQQKSLDYLSKMLRLHLIDIDTARHGFGLPPISNQSVEGDKDRPAIML